MSKQMDYFSKPLHLLYSNELFRMPELSMQTASLTPLEKYNLALLMIAIKPKTIVETGVWRGLTTKFVADFVRENNLESLIIGFDLPDVIDELITNSFFSKDLENVEFVKGLLPYSLQNWLSEKKPAIDLAIIDADHNYYSAFTELSAIQPYISDEGYIFCHDYGLDQNNHEGVFCAVEDFCLIYKFDKLPLQSIPSSPKTLTSAQSVLLRRKMKTTLRRKLHHIKKYIRRKYFTKKDDIQPYKLS